MLLCMYVLLLTYSFLQNMAVDDRSLADLTQDIINCHQTLVGWSPATAEVEYILEAQQLEGYGMEYYSAKVCPILVVWG